MNPFECKPKKPEQFFSSRELSAKAYDKNEVDPYTRLRVVPNGKPKSSIVDGGVLFDDEKRNRDEWESSGAGAAYGPDNMIKRIMAIAATSV